MNGNQNNNDIKNDNNLEEKKPLVYTIPGAIIPEQVTDSGNVIESDNVNTGVSVNNSTNSNSYNVNNTTNINNTTNSSLSPNASSNISANNSNLNSDSNIGISTGVSNNMVGNNINLGSNINNTTNSSLNPNVNSNVSSNISSNLTSDTSISSNSNFNSSNSNNLNNNMSISTSENTNINDNGNKKKRKSKKNNNQSGGSATVGLLFFLVLILSGVVIYFVYNTYFSKKEVIDFSTQAEGEKIANINSLVVRQLYSYVNLTGCEEQINFFYDNNKTEIISSDLTDSDKNYLAFNQLKNSSLEKQACSTYSKALHKNDSENIWYCGELDNLNNYNDEDKYTYLIKGSEIKDNVDHLFGLSSYKPSTFKIGSNSRYLYDDKTDSYILQTHYGSSSCVSYKNQLSSASFSSDILTISVVVTNKVTNAVMKFNYRFKESSDGNYYFISLSKVDI